MRARLFILFLLHIFIPVPHLDQELELFNLRCSSFRDVMNFIRNLSENLSTNYSLPPTQPKWNLHNHIHNHSFPSIPSLSFPSLSPFLPPPPSNQSNPLGICNGNTAYLCSIISFPLEPIRFNCVSLNHQGSPHPDILLHVESVRVKCERTEQVDWRMLVAID